MCSSFADQPDGRSPFTEAVEDAKIRRLPVLYHQIQECPMALVDRVKNILLTPGQEWAVIDAEATAPVELYKGYIMPLAAIPPVAKMLGTTILGYHSPIFGTVRAPFFGAL